ncbi:hypothetical protein J2777_005957 [Paraburkholderia graminis]|uniref:hypothetical protein n=1 Tax=Paraburkholderia graminis TaxID=60548 RepID=UPI00285C971A|nr:hypothetical protein [Paraburkholderia graminis]MDR6472216.1 hypothetical protein [Paraburkholderia graminis]
MWATAKGRINFAGKEAYLRNGTQALASASLCKSSGIPVYNGEHACSRSAHFWHPLPAQVNRQAGLPISKSEYEPAISVVYGAYRISLAMLKTRPGDIKSGGLIDLAKGRVRTSSQSN